MYFIRIILFLIILHLTPIQTNPIEGELINSLLKNYNKISRPSPAPLNSTNGTESESRLTVKLGLTLLQIINVDEKQQILTLNCWQTSSWSDSALVWNTSDYGNLSSVRIPVQHIWKPDILVYNIADEDILQSAFHLGSMNAIVYYNGEVLFVPPMILKTSCKMDVTLFPFDEQECQITLGSWTYSGYDMELELMDAADVGNGSFDVSGYIANGEWQIMGTSADKTVKHYACCVEPYYTVTFTLRIKRKWLYYFFNLVVPCALIGFLAILGFTLPPDSGEKLSLGVTVLFSLIVFLNMISASMPSTSDAVPLLGTYFNCVMFMIASSVVSTIVVNLNIRCGGGQPRKIGRISQKLFFNWLPRLLRMEGMEFPDVKGADNFPPSDKPRTLDVDTDGDKPLIMESGGGGGETGLSRVQGKYLNLTNKVTNGDIFQSKDVSVNLDSNLLKRKWMFAAVVVDRLCLTVSVIFIIISTIVLLISTLC